MFLFDLVTLTFHENSYHGRKITENLDFEFLLLKINFFWSFFCSFSNAPQKTACLCFQPYLNILFYKFTFSTCFIWLPNNKTRYQKMVKIKDTQFCVKNLKMKRKNEKKILTFRGKDLNPRFSVIFQPMIWIFMWSE